MDRPVTRRDADAVLVPCVVLVTAAVVLWLGASLRPDGFVAGDPGLKLIAAANAIAHPWRPFQIDRPAIGTEPTDLVDRFFTRHGDHAHLMQSPLFPVVTAPLVAAFGLRGAYVLPALAFVALFPLVVLIARALDAPLSRAALAVAAIACSPVTYYAFELWEHVPAVALLAASTAVAWRPNGRDRTQGAVAGLLAGLATLLRPEAVWYAGALAITLRFTPRGRAYVASLVVIAAAFAAGNIVEGANPLGWHASATLAGLSTGRGEARLARLAAWLLPAAWPFRVAIAGIATAWLLHAYRRRAAAQLLGLTAAAVLAVGAALDMYPDGALWRAWPLGALILVPQARLPGLGRVTRVAVVTALGVWLTSTHDGGAQWGPRFLLIATPAFVLLAAAGLQQAIAAGPWRAWRAAATTVVVMAALWTSRSAYGELRGAKRHYAAIVEAIAAATEPHGYVVTDVWWLDQIAAPLYGSRTFLVIDSPSASAGVLARLQRAGVNRVLLAWSAEPDAPGPLSTAGTCFVDVGTEILAERDLHLTRAICPAATGADR